MPYSTHRPRPALIAGLTSLVLALLAGLLAVGAGPARAALDLSSTPAASYRVNGRVYAEVIVGGTLFVGGDFTTATSPSGSTVARMNLAAFSMTTGAVTSFRADTDGVVRALSASSTQLYLGGAFRTVSGVTRPYVAKLAVATGAVVTAFNPKPNSGLRALELSGSALYFGGTFTTVSGVARGRVARVDATSGAVSSWTAPTNGAVYALDSNPVSKAVYIGGDFTTVGGKARASMAAVDPSTGAVLSPVFAGSSRPVLSLTVNDAGTMVFGGMGAQINAVYAWSASTGARAWRVTTDGDVQAVAVYDGVVYAGFHDGYQGDTSTKLLAISATTGAVGGFRPTFDQFYGVFALAASSAGLAVGGEFTRVTGVQAQGFARFPAS